MPVIIQNRDALATTEARKDALAVAEAGLAAVNMEDVIEHRVRIEGGTLFIDDYEWPLTNRRVFFVGVGKCALVAAKAVEQLFGDRLTGGIALDVQGSSSHHFNTIKVFTGTHPKPSETNLEVAARIVEMLELCTKDDLVLILVSGGGSTLLCLHDAPMTCLAEGVLFDELTGKGASIQEMNTVRKHISLARGGGLAKAAYPAEVVSLIVSDVPGNDLQSIASGPTVMDSSTAADAEAVLERYGVQLPPGGLIETPKEERYFERVLNMLFLTNHDALVAMAEEAERRGYTADIVDEAFHSEAREVAKDVLAKLHESPKKTALLYGGESTVKLPVDHGEGGRNQEIALITLDTVRDDELILPFASDGKDASMHAGAIADAETRNHAQSHGASAADALATHDSHAFFETTNDALKTGLLGSNVSDLLLALKS